MFIEIFKYLIFHKICFEKYEFGRLLLNVSKYISNFNQMKVYLIP